MKNNLTEKNISTNIKVNKIEWDLSPLFKSENDLQMGKLRKKIEVDTKKFVNKWSKRTDYLKNPAVLKQALDEYEKWLRENHSGGKEGYYFWLRGQQNQNNSQLKARAKKIDDFSTKIGNEMQFFGMRVSKIEKNLQKKFLDYKGLEIYKHDLERSFAGSKYLLSEPEEKLMNLLSGPAYNNWVKMTSAFLAKEEREVILENGKQGKKSFAEIMNLMGSVNKPTRDSAAAVFNEILIKHSDVAEHEINAVLEDKKVNDELRKLPRPDSGRHVDDDVESKMVDILSDAVSKRFDISKRYYKLKARLFRVKKLRYHERNVPYGKIDKKYSYQDAINLIGKVFSDLDGKFFEIFSSFVGNNRIDVYPKKGKDDGAFCVHTTITTPTYILLNFDGKLNSVTTIAHEAGHGINNELMREKQNAINFGSPTSTAEVASTFMEDFVLKEVEKGVDDETRLAIMMQKLNDDVSTIFRQIACYRFEQELHKVFREKGYLPKEEIGRLFQKHMASYMGEFVEQTEESKNWWIYWGHIRRFFYNYSYASGLLISKYLQSRVQKDCRFIENVKEFLATGLSESPKDIFKKMGIDINSRKFWNQGIDEIEELLDEAEKLAKKLGK